MEAHNPQHPATQARAGFPMALGVAFGIALGIIAGPGLIFSPRAGTAAAADPRVCTCPTPLRAGETTHVSCPIQGGVIHVQCTASPEFRGMKGLTSW